MHPVRKEAMVMAYFQNLLRLPNRRESGSRGSGRDLADFQRASLAHPFGFGEIYSLGFIGSS